MRAQSRQYEQLIRARKAIAAQGRALVLAQGYGPMKGSWWRVYSFAKWQKVLPEWITKQLEVWQANLCLLDRQIAGAKSELIKSVKEVLPKGFGGQSMARIDREISDWGRFSTRRKVGCFGGFVPQEHSTGEGQRLGSITKVGSPRIRALIVEMAWRLVRFQPGYGPIMQWSQALCGNNPVKKKKAIV